MYFSVFPKCISHLLWVVERSSCMSQILDCCQTGPNHIPLLQCTLKQFEKIFQYLKRNIYRWIWYSEYSPVCGRAAKRYLAPQRLFLLPIETVMSSCGAPYFSTVFLNCISQIHPQLYFLNVFGLWAVADAPRGSFQICWTSGRLKYFEPSHRLDNDVWWLRCCSHTRTSRSLETL